MTESSDFRRPHGKHYSKRKRKNRIIRDHADTESGYEPFDSHGAFLARHGRLQPDGHLLCRHAERPDSNRRRYNCRNTSSCF